MPARMEQEVRGAESTGDCVREKDVEATRTAMDSRLVHIRHHQVAVWNIKSSFLLSILCEPEPTAGVKASTFTRCQ